MAVSSYSPYGADGVIIRVEADIRRGIPGVDVTGLANGAVREARERVRAAFRNSGFAFPSDRVLINLAPAGLRKEGAALDLPIAVAVMAAGGLVPDSEDVMVLGELELSGRVRPVRGVLAAVAAGRASGISGFIVPEENAAEAAILAPDMVVPVRTLMEAATALGTRRADGGFAAQSCAVPGVADSAEGLPQCPDFADAAGQHRYKRALEIAAAGGHNLLVFGPPGSGKTLLARALPGIMAPLDDEEAVEVTRLHSLAGALGEGQALVRSPPFRSPHHSASAEGLLGGGRQVRPGEISLAHRGTLFLDEAPEFRQDVLCALREPLEDGLVTISRAEGSVRLPADFQLLLAANPCPCGRLGLPGAGSCFCSSQEIQHHWRRLGSALLDRVALRVPLLPPVAEDLAAPPAENSAAIRHRVVQAVAMQKARQGGRTTWRNARIGLADLRYWCALTKGVEHEFSMLAARHGFSARAGHAVLRVARTIADLAGREAIEEADLLEAVEHRRYGDDPWDILSFDTANAARR